MHRNKVLVSGLLLALLLANGLAGGQAGLPTAQATGSGVELTVYNQDLALVKERRSLQLDEGLNEVHFSDVAARIDPTSVHFRSLTDPEGTVVWEQNFEYDVVGSERLLEKYVDQDIRLVTEDGTVYEGTLLSGTGDIILQRADGGVTVVQRDRVQEFGFPELPEGLITRPTLVWLLETVTAGEHQAEVTYMTGGLNWSANYVVLLAQDEGSLDLDGWVTLDNRSGATYRDAKLKLIAGDIHRAPQVAVAKEVMMYEVMPMAVPAPPVEEREFFEYHLYEVQRPVTVRDKQTKQIEFVTATGVPAEKFFVYDGSRGLSFWGSPNVDQAYGAQTGSTKVQVMLQFKTGKDGVDAELPRGTVRVYKEDVDGTHLLVGEDSIDHTPKDEQVRLYLGDAFDIVGERTQTGFNRLGDRALEETYRIRVRNHKAEEVEVRVVEHLFRWTEWEITRESAEHEKLDAQTVEWRLAVPADGEAELTYTVRYRW
ncbi:MAG: DUF4139 domain-containing protein [Anaerolineae bacterium]|nr:DUF4139 domain-containing protein [Anaerolineae bacterium]